MSKTVYVARNIKAEELLNILNKRSIRVYNLHFRGEDVVFSVLPKQTYEVDNLIKRSLIDGQKVKEGGKKKVLKSVLANSGFILGAIILCIVCVYFNSFIYQLEISGCEGERLYQLTAELEEKGIKQGVKKNTLQYDEISRELIEKVDGLSFLSIYESKGKIIAQAIYKDEPIEEQKKDKIFAAFDGIITRVLVTSGTAVVKEGDRVLKGDLLIDGYIDLGDPLDPNNERVAVEADGVVYARVWLSESLVISEKTIQAKRTGNTETVRYVFTDMNAKTNTPVTKFAYSDCEIEESIINSILPFKTVTYTFYEVEFQEVITDRQMLDTKIFEACNRLTLKLNKDKLLDKWVNEKKVDCFYYIDVYYEVERAIND